MDNKEKAQVLGHEPLTFEQMQELEQMYMQHDWEKVRHQAAIAALQSLIPISEAQFGERFYESYAKRAVLYADALVKELMKIKEEQI